MRTAELVLLRFCPPGPLARYVSTSHWASNCASFSLVQVVRVIITLSIPHLLANPLLQSSFAGIAFAHFPGRRNQSHSNGPTDDLPWQNNQAPPNANALDRQCRRTPDQGLSRKRRRERRGEHLIGPWKLATGLRAAGQGRVMPPMMSAPRTRPSAASR